SILWAGVIISSFFLIARIWIRIRILHRFQADDIFVISSWLLALANAAIWQAIWPQLYLTIDIGSGRLTQYPANLIQQMETFLRGNYSAYVLSYTSLWSVKMSFLFFFRGLGEKIRSQRILWWCVLAFIVASYAVCIGTLDYICLFASGTDIIKKCSGHRAIWYEYITLRLATSLDVVTDFMIIVLSANIVMRVHIDLRKKLALLGICSLTAFIITITIVRVVVATDGKILDLSWLILFQGAELSVAIIVACLATFRTLYTMSKR
ncbi:hypothetical protein K432DRAFT_274115, partial [Lepidopterella palustris CBS 459.81]